MRILHLLATPYWSGPAESVALLARAQREQGHKVTIAVDRKRTRAPAEEPIAPRLERLGLLDGGGLVLSVKASPMESLADVRLLHRRELDVVHAHLSHDHFLARLGRPKDAILVRSIHAPRSLRWSTPAADAFTVPAESMLGALHQRPGAVLPALAGEGFRPSGDRGALRARLALSGEPVIGMVSTFKPSRRHALGLAAFAQLRRQVPSARLVLVGDGALGTELRAEGVRLGLGDSVTFAGYQSGEAFVPWLQALDEVWILGLGNDFAARAAAQARACGVRVVAVCEGALPELADAIVADLAPEAVVQASRSGQRRAVALPEAAAVARSVLGLYQAARGRSG